ncbi:MAG TPA: GNAT family N-acetyltransferase [Sphingobium sp.]|uniref:GNAT family N-acetyltransferase n=1 Tax=Sphingobium sp. TaxID=1912891 RepID=UPI002ED3E1D2
MTGPALSGGPALPDGYALREGADAAAAHAYLTRSYWAEGISLDTVERSLDGSFCVSVLYGAAQVGMVRVITDFATFAYLTDVYVLEAHQGQGLASAMLAYLRAYAPLQGLRHWTLFTHDAHSLYARHGFEAYEYPDRLMVLHNPNAC